METPTPPPSIIMDVLSAALMAFFLSLVILHCRWEVLQYQPYISTIYSLHNWLLQEKGQVAFTV